jgi:long-chain acyl-CoA synthetase
MSDRTIGSMVQRRIQETPAAVALRVKDGTSWRDISWRDFGARIERIAAGLFTALDDLPPRAAVAIIGNTSQDWIACDFAALSMGLRTIPVYATLLPEEAGYLHVDSEAIISIVEDAEQLAKVRALRDGFSFFDRKYEPSEVKVRKIVVMNPTGVDPADDWESLADLEARGAEQLEATRAKRQEWGDVVMREDVCTYTYTSGTTGPPKGAVQTNHNMLSMLEYVDSTGMFDERVRPGGLFLFLPLAHSFGRLIEFAGPFFQCPIVVSAIPTLAADLGETRPGFFPAAPRVFEKIKAKVEGKVAGAPPARQKLFAWAIGAGKASLPYRTTGKPMPLGVKLSYAAANKIVLSKLRAALGFDRAIVLLSGSAPLAPEVHEFFMAMGLDLLEAYGLTETCPGLTTNLPGAIKIGTVGRPFPGVEIKIAEDGEILAKGGNVVSGYLNRPDATQEAFNAEGWFCTGDLGTKDADGFIKITGRKKELMKTSGGKYIAPAKIEGRLKNHPLVQEAVTVADTRNYACALLAVDLEELGPWAERNGVAADPKSDAVRKELQAHVDEVNKTLAQYESIKKFAVVPPMTVESGLLTASLKVKRKVVYERYAGEIEALYKGGGGD